MTKKSQNSPFLREKYRDDIIETAKKFNIKAEILWSRDRHHNIVAARKYLTQRLRAKDLHYTKIGKILSRDRTSIMAYCGATNSAKKRARKQEEKLKKAASKLPIAHNGKPAETSMAVLVLDKKQAIKLATQLGFTPDRIRYMDHVEKLKKISADWQKEKPATLWVFFHMNAEVNSKAFRRGILKGI